MSTAVVRSRSPSPSLSENGGDSTIVYSRVGTPTSALDLQDEQFTDRLHLTDYHEEGPSDGSSGHDSDWEAHAPLRLGLTPLHRCPRYPPVPRAFCLRLDQLVKALEDLAQAPLLDKSKLFPWMNAPAPFYADCPGFNLLEHTSDWTRHPTKLRTIMLLKAGNDLSRCRLRGTVDSTEVLDDSLDRFRSDAELSEGKVRRYKLQTQKWANVADVVIYGDDTTTPYQLRSLANRVVNCQRLAHLRHDTEGQNPDAMPCLKYNTFILCEAFADITDKHRQLVDLDAAGNHTAYAIDMLEMERRQLGIANAPTEIAPNVFVGCQMRPPYNPPFPDDKPFDAFVECRDAAAFPSLVQLRDQLFGWDGGRHVPTIKFPGTTDRSKRSVQDKQNAVVQVCQWIAYLTTGPRPLRRSDLTPDLPLPMGTDSIPQGRRLCIHCLDGYSDLAFLTIAYTMFTQGLACWDAWLSLHHHKGRDLMIQSRDMKFLIGMQDRLLTAGEEMFQSDFHPVSKEPKWLWKATHGFPSRITPYMYLGSLSQANQPDMLWELGIRRMLSVGEEAGHWLPEQKEKWGEDNLLMIDNLQDNGVDSLGDRLAVAVEWLQQGKRQNKITFVHCRVGVSRSATICIAEIMKSRNLSLAEAFCYVRARRHGVCIQPSLLLMYDLLKWEADLQRERGQVVRRPLEWHVLAREIHRVNKANVAESRLKSLARLSEKLRHNPVWTQQPVELKSGSAFMDIDLE
ncbi:tyrosine/serine/threonine protein phosphatase pps1 [Ascosphaera acerosa]|nr:tyrosine/serine/threonine protein phosphatase pps1 [Ascosphaera acerosa]